MCYAGRRCLGIVADDDGDDNGDDTAFNTSLVCAVGTLFVWSLTMIVVVAIMMMMMMMI